MAKNVCYLAALALPEWQRTAGAGKLQLREEVLVDRSRRKHQRELRSQRPPQPPLLTADGGHFWVPCGASGFRCTFCSARASDRTKAAKSASPCKRDLGKLGQVIERAGETKHCLHWSVHQRTGMRVLSCNRCDAYATMTPKHLIRECVTRIPQTKLGSTLVGSIPQQQVWERSLLLPPDQGGPHRCS